MRRDAKYRRNRRTYPHTKPSPISAYIAPLIDPDLYENEFAMDGETTDIADELVALTDSPIAIPKVLSPVASGLKVRQNHRVIFDYSNVKDGYVMVKFIGTTDKKLKVQVAGPTTTYTYNLSVGKYETFPFSDGNGDYKVTVYENTTGTKYATVLSLSVNVKLTDEFAPFLRPNQYVDYDNAIDVQAKAAELCQGQIGVLDKVAAVYDWVVQNISYDKQKAKTVQSGYLPVLDNVIRTKTGICFDYAALMAGMLRAQGVPCKLVVGYAGSAYHAWISVYSPQTGWVDDAIFFDGNKWQRMDPTFASSGNSSESILKYIGDGSNYTVKYMY